MRIGFVSHLIENIGAVFSNMAVGLKRAADRLTSFFWRTVHPQRNQTEVSHPTDLKQFRSVKLPSGGVQVTVARDALSEEDLFFIEKLNKVERIKVLILEIPELGKITSVTLPSGGLKVTLKNNTITSEDMSMLEALNRKHLIEELILEVPHLSEEVSKGIRKNLQQSSLSKEDKRVGPGISEEEIWENVDL